MNISRLIEIQREKYITSRSNTILQRRIESYNYTDEERDLIGKEVVARKDSGLVQVGDLIHIVKVDGVISYGVYVLGMISYFTSIESFDNYEDL